MLLRYGDYMLRFKKYTQLSEARRATPAIKDWLTTRSKPYQYWLSSSWNMPFPISKPMMTRLAQTATDVDAAHSTNLSGLRTLFDIQGSAKSISAFTTVEDGAMGLEMIQGIDTTGGIIAEVRGDIPFKGAFDIFSSPDSQGRRWFNLRQYSHNREFAGKHPDFLRDYELLYNTLLYKFTDKFLNKKMIDDLYKFDIFLHGDARKYTLESALAIKLFWVGSATENPNSKSPGGIRENIRKKLSEIVQRMDKKESRTEGRKLQMLSQKIIKQVDRVLFSMTKALFDMAEKYFEENIIEFMEMTAMGEGIALYDEAIMDNIDVMAVYYDQRVVSEEDVMSVTEGDVPTVGFNEDKHWVKYFQKWIRRQDLRNLPDVTAAWGAVAPTSTTPTKTWP